MICAVKIKIETIPNWHIQQKMFKRGAQKNVQYQFGTSSYFILFKLSESESV